MPDPISWGHAWPYLFGALAVGYLLGSVPFGLLITRLGGAGDIRAIGSGNIGATNVLRTGRKGLAAATLGADFGKGLLAAGGAWALYGPDVAHMAGLGAVLGHMFPVWLRFRGGKAVATSGGVMAGLSWPVALGAALVWIGVAATSRYSSAAALAAALAAPAVAWAVGAFQTVELLVIVAALVWWAHRANLQRLMTGEEPKIGAHRDDA
ncbi:MAG: glycerol-3-phosphate 1-O-acyltransferase PlsY [Pseudomonadota bacterium]